MTKKHKHPGSPDDEAPPMEPSAEAVAVDPDAPASTPAAAAPSAEPTREVDAVQEKYLRLAAEYDNFRKRTAKERLELSARAQGELVSAIIDPLDDLARIIAQGPGASDAKTVLDAVEVLDKKMMKALAAAGLEVINPVGEPFDPTRHEAVSIAPAASPADDQLVAQVFQPGYLFKGQLLRAARVVVKQWNG